MNVTNETKERTGNVVQRCCCPHFLTRRRKEMISDPCRCVRFLTSVCSSFSLLVRYFNVRFLLSSQDGIFIQRDSSDNLDPSAQTTNRQTERQSHVCSPNLHSFPIVRQTHNNNNIKSCKHSFFRVFKWAHSRESVNRLSPRILFFSLFPWRCAENPRIDGNVCSSRAEQNGKRKRLLSIFLSSSSRSTTTGPNHHEHGKRQISSRDYADVFARHRPATFNRTTKEKLCNFVANAKD